MVNISAERLAARPSSGVSPSACSVSGDCDRVAGVCALCAFGVSAAAPPGVCVICACEGGGGGEGMGEEMSAAAAAAVARASATASAASEAMEGG